MTVEAATGDDVAAQSDSTVLVAGGCAIGCAPTRYATVRPRSTCTDATHRTWPAMPQLVCFAESTDDVRAIVQVANEFEVPFVARGSGTGLAGGAVPLGGSIVICVSKMNRIISVDPVNRLAWVEPGVLNLDLSKQIAHLGVHFAPDPSSQQTCSIGGNVANNSGGPHCLADGVTSAHIHAVEVVLPDGSVTVLGGEEPEPAGFDLRGAFVGSEGMFGVATKVCVKLTQNPPDIATMLLDFADVADGAQLVSDMIAAGIVPAAVEMMDQLCLRAVEDFIHAGLPVDQAAALLIEVVGLRGRRGRADHSHPGAGSVAQRRYDSSRRRRHRARPAVEGPQVRLRSDRSNQAELLPPRHGGPSAQAP